MARVAPRFEVIEDGCATPRYEVWDSVEERVVAVYRDRDTADHDAARREREASR